MDIRIGGDILQLNCILIVDDLTRKEMRINISDLVLYNVKIFSSLREIDRNTAESYSNVVILEHYVNTPNALSDLKNYKYAFKFNYFYLGTDNRWLTAMASIAKTYKMDVTLLDYKKLSSVLFNNRAELDRVLLSEDKLSFNDAVAKELLQESSDKNVKALARDYIALKEVLDIVLVDNEDFKDINNNLYDSIHNIIQENHRVTENYKNIILNGRELNRTLSQYENILAKDIYTKIPLANYKNKPKIIYIKQYDEMLYMESFLQTMFLMFKVQAKSSVKLIKLFDGASNMLIHKLPSYYKMIENKYLTSDIINSDFIAKIGNYRGILDILLNNKYTLDILIIVDCKNYNDTVLVGPTLHLNVCRNVKDIESFNLSKENTITNNGQRDLSWEYYSNFSSFESQEDQFAFLTSRPVMQRIYNLACNNFGIR